MKLLTAIGALTFLLATPAFAQTRVYVSPTGSDKWSGRLPAPNKARTDGPFASLERARDLLRQRKLATAATVFLRGGDYYRDQSFTLGAEDGSKIAPVTYRAYPGETPRLIGGRPVTNWRPVTDQTVLARFTPGVRAHVRQADLTALGIPADGPLLPRAFGMSDAPPLPPMELFSHNQPMTLARWPNDWARVTQVPSGTEGQFGYAGNRPARWKSLDDVWVYGYFGFDWADVFEKVTAFDTDTHTVRVAPPYSPFGYRANQRFYFVNVLEELDAPGEYFLDRKQQLLYFWPLDTPAQETKPADTFVSSLSDPLIDMKGASGVTVQGLTLEGCRSNAIEIKGGARNLIAGCVLRNIGRVAVAITDGATDSGVQSCDISQTGDGGIVLDGGDRKTLTPGGLFAVNNHIYHTARLRRTYTPAVSINGVGCRVANNRIHDLPHSALQGGGNDHLIEYNEIYRVCQETGDAGAFYMGRDFTQRGNVVRFNHFHDLRAGGLGGQEGFTDVMGVYLDDCFSGVTVYGNLFVRAGRSAMIGGGRDNTIENNIFIDGSPAVHVDSRGKSWAAKYFVPNGEWHIFETLAAADPTQPPYSTRYPQLVTLRDDDPSLAKGNRILRNLSVGGKWLEMQDNLTDKIVQFEGNLTDGDPGFVDAARGNYRLKPGSPALKQGFKPLPLEKMGLRLDAYRKTLPPRN